MKYKLIYISTTIFFLVVLFFILYVDINIKKEKQVVDSKFICLSKICVDGYCFEDILLPKKYKMEIIQDKYNGSNVNFILFETTKNGCQ